MRQPGDKQTDVKIDGQADGQQSLETPLSVPIIDNRVQFLPFGYEALKTIIQKVPQKMKECNKQVKKYT